MALCDIERDGRSLRIHSALLEKETCIAYTPPPVSRVIYASVGLLSLAAHGSPSRPKVVQFLVSL